MVARRGSECSPFDAACVVDRIGFIIGAETGGNTRKVTIQLQDPDGRDLARRGSVEMYLSDDSNGDSIVAVAPSGGWAIAADGLLLPIVANKYARFVSEADGDIDINIVEAGAKTVYVVAILPDGGLAVSDAIVFAA